MYSYVTKELPPLVDANFAVDPDRQAIFGHSMGGHGALTIALRQPGRYPRRARSPDRRAVASSVGQKALDGYLGNDQRWRPNASAALIEDGARVPDLLVDVGDADKFLKASCARTAARRVRKPDIPLRCADSRATTTATTSSPRSWPIICAGTQSA